MGYLAYCFSIGLLAMWGFRLLRFGLRKMAQRYKVPQQHQEHTPTNDEYLKRH